MFLILVITCAEITIVLTYFQLIAEDYRWWWRSVFTSGSSALYVFLYSIFYFATRLAITRAVSIVLFFAYSLMICFLFFLLSGTVGFLASFWFVNTIFKAVKVGM